MISKINELFIDYVPFRIREKFYNFRDFIFSRQKWLIKKIPNQWIDKDTLIWIVIKECIIHFVDGEKCFEVVKWDDGRIESKKFADALHENFTKINSLVPLMEKEKENVWGEAVNYLNKNDRINYDIYTKKGNELERQLDEEKKKIMHWFVENKNWFWV